MFGRNLSQLLSAKAIELLSAPVPPPPPRQPYLEWCAEKWPDMAWNWPHLRLIGEHIEDILNGRYKRLLVSMPPQHGKSTGITHRLPLYLMSQRRGFRVGVGSYNTEYGEYLSRHVQKCAESAGFKLKGKKASSEWELENGSSLYAFGIGKGVTGRPLDMVIIDDPVKNREDADSEAVRQKAWDWWADDVKPRLQEGSPAIAIMCMVGSTRVLMADGTERLLKDIKPGDTVASYSDGNIVPSLVSNWINQGSDLTYEIATSSGKLARANERHPFLVLRENGKTEWVRLKNLRTGDQIVTVEKIGANGKAFTAQLRNADSQQNVKDFATRIIANGDARTDTEQLRTHHKPGDVQECCIATGLHRKDLKSYSPNKMADVQFVNNCRTIKTHAHTGETSCALTTITRPEKYAGCSATIVTSWSDTAKHLICSRVALSTYKVTCDVITSIVETGYEEVFDIQVDNTENFIANGLVSHNTRWHTDDLGGRWLDRESKLWRYLKLSAIAEENDPLGRKPGEPLCTARFSLATLVENQEASPETFEALYQQNPVPRGGSMFKDEWFKHVMKETRLGDRARRVRYWDLAATKKETSKWTSGVLLAFDGRNFMIEDIERFREGPAERNERMRQVCEQDAARPGFYRTYFEEQPGAAGVETSENLIRYLRGFPVEADRVTGDKVTRAEPVATACRGGMIQILVAHWNAKFLSELCLFPRGTYLDQVDSLSGAYNKLARGPAAIAI